MAGSPSIYWHGKLADSGVIERKNLSRGMVSYAGLIPYNKDSYPASEDDGEYVLELTTIQ